MNTKQWMLLSVRAAFSTRPFDQCLLKQSGGCLWGQMRPSPPRLYLQPRDKRFQWCFQSRQRLVSKNTTVRITMATGDIRQDAAERNNKRDIRAHSSVTSCHPFVSCRQIYYRGGLFIYFYLFARDFPDSI